MCNEEGCHLHCLSCRPHTYIRMVQHLIERCLLLHMSRDDCINAILERAGVQPSVTLTVWNELQKENEGFFKDYYRAISQRGFSSKPMSHYSCIILSNR